MLKGTIFVGYQNRNFLLQNVCAKLPSSSNIHSSQNWYRCSEMTRKQRHIDVLPSLLLLSSNTNKLIGVNTGILILLHRCLSVSEHLLFAYCNQASNKLSYIVCKKISTMLKCSVLIHMVTTRNLVDCFILRFFIVKTWRKDPLKIKEFCLHFALLWRGWYRICMGLKLFNGSFRLSL